MAKKVTIEVDAAAATLGIMEGRLFLGTEAVVELDGWTPDEGCRPVLTLFTPGSHQPVATTSWDATDPDAPVLTLNLTGEAIRRAFHGEAARHCFVAYLNQQVSEDEGSTWNYLPDVEAEGRIWIEWSPETFEVTDDGTAMAALQGPPGQDGQDGKSAYQLAVEQGFAGTLAEWLASINAGNALTGKTFDFSAANARKMADALKMIFEALGGTVT